MAEWLWLLLAFGLGVAWGGLGGDGRARQAQQLLRQAEQERDQARQQLDRAGTVVGQLYVAMASLVGKHRGH